MFILKKLNLIQRFNVVKCIKEVLKAVNKELEHREQLLETQIKVLERRILALEASKHKLKEHIRCMKQDTKLESLKQFNFGLRGVKRKRDEVDYCSLDGAGLFKTVPLYTLKKILDYLPCQDIKTLRCLSSWFFKTVSVEVRSVFGTYHIKDSNLSLRFPAVLIQAMIRPYGPKLKLHFQIKSHSINTSNLVKNMIILHKNSIVSLDIYFHNFQNYQINPHGKFSHLESLDLHFPVHFDKLVKKYICETLLAKNFKHLKRLGLESFNLSQDKLLQLPVLSKLTTLKLHKVDVNSTKAFYDATKNANLEEIDLNQINGDIAFDLVTSNYKTVNVLKLNHVDFSQIDAFGLKLKKLKHLELTSITGISTMDFIYAGKQTILGLKVSNTHFPYWAFNEVKFVKLQRIQLEDVYGRAIWNLIKSASANMTEIIVKDTDFEGVRVSDIHMPNLKSIDLSKVNEKVTITLLKSGLNSLKHLKLESIPIKEKEVMKTLRFSNLQTLELSFINGSFAFSLLKSCSNTIRHVNFKTLFPFNGIVTENLKFSNLKSLHVESRYKDFATALVEAGIDTIAYLNIDGIEISSDRITAFKNAMLENKIKLMHQILFEL